MLGMAPCVGEKEREDVHSPPVVVIFDLDGTLTRRDTFRRFLLAWLWRHPWRIASCWRLPLSVTLYAVRLETNSRLKIRFLTAILRGVHESELATFVPHFVSRVLATGMHAGTVAALRQCQENSHRTILLSASPDIFVREFAARLGFSEWLCTMAERDAGGRLTGRLAGANCHGEEKVARIARCLGEERAQCRVIVYADDASDLSLMRWADEAIVVSPSASFGDRAGRLGFRIVHW
jgi:phosphatidylglycerophosphatase C